MSLNLIDNKTGEFIKLKTISNIDGTDSLAVDIQDTTVDITEPVTVDGTVTVNAGTNLNTSALALEAGNLADVKTAVQIIDNIVSGNEAQVDVITMPAVTAVDLDIRNLTAANDTVVVTGGAGQTADVKVTLDSETVVLGTGSATVGATTDAGFKNSVVHTVVNGNISSATNVSGAPTAGQKLVLTDLLISTSAAATVTIKEETSGTVVHGPYYMPASGTLQITTRGTPMSKLATADKHYQAISSTTDAVTVETWTYSEA